MRSASINELKKQLTGLPQEELIKLCLRLARYKKENKELLTYLLFEAGDEAGYVNSIKEQLEEEFLHINKTNLYYSKKTIRKILRIVKKFIKYSGNKETEVELLLFFCQKLRETDIALEESKTLINLYQRQLITIRKALSHLHEDLQYDYEIQISALI